MTAEEKFFVLLKALADATSNYELTRETIATWDRMLCGKYGHDRVNVALEKLLWDKSSKDPFPGMKDVVQILEPKDDPQSAAVLAAHNIVEAVRKDGYTNPDRARSRMGELAWSVVSKSGGWIAVCELITDRNVGQMVAQFRDLAKAIQSSGLPHIGPDTPRLDSPPLTGAVGLSSLGDLLKSIPAPKDEEKP